MTATAYERILEKLREQGKKVRQGTSYSVAQCPSYDHRQTSLTVYSKPGKAKVVCFAGCSDMLDVLPALGMTVADLYDERGKSNAKFDLPRLEARKAMTPPQRALDNLLQMPDLGERICLGIARIRPELYIGETEQLWGETDG
jgi:hypothetical protein